MRPEGEQVELLYLIQKFLTVSCSAEHSSEVAQGAREGEQVACLISCSLALHQLSFGKTILQL